VPFLLAEERMGSLVILLLVERAPSEGPRSTRAIEDRPGRPARKGTSELGGSMIETWSIDPQSKGRPWPLP
jgi:hypothetical protein